MSSETPSQLIEGAPLAPWTTLGVGGPARYLVPCRGVEELRRALTWARARRLPTFILGGGSNLLVSDDGFDGAVLRLEGKGEAPRFESRGEVTRVSVPAAHDWDELVSMTVDAGLAGLEAMSGIPGLAGAAPIQNVGAYGQELAQVLEAVWVLERASGEERRISAEECAFGYRHSRFKADWLDRFVILSLELRLCAGAPGVVAYRELARHLGVSLDGDGVASAPVAEIRQAVLALRRAKSMVLEAGDPNRRSAGSFFVNPVVSSDAAARAEAAARAAGTERAMPRWPAPGGVKLSAAWLIEEAGFQRGFTAGAAGLSSRHTLALINRGSARAADLLALAAKIRRTVRERFAVTLRPEPRFLGFRESPETLLTRYESQAS